MSDVAFDMAACNGLLTLSQKLNHIARQEVSDSTWLELSGRLCSRRVAGVPAEWRPGDAQLDVA